MTSFILLLFLSRMCLAEIILVTREPSVKILQFNSQQASSAASSACTNSASALSTFFQTNHLGEQEYDQLGVEAERSLLSGVFVKAGRQPAGARFHSGSLP